MRLGAAAHANDERCALKPMYPSLHYCLRIHEHVPPMPSCAQVPLPSAVLTSAGAFRSDRTARVSAVASGGRLRGSALRYGFPFVSRVSIIPTDRDGPASGVGSAAMRSRRHVRRRSSDDRLVWRV